MLPPTLIIRAASHTAPGRAQPVGTYAHTDPVFDRLAAREIELGAATPGQVQDLQLTLEYCKRRSKNRPYDAV
jgi:hypothetical protein